MALNPRFVWRAFSLLGGAVLLAGSIFTVAIWLRSLGRTETLEVLRGRSYVIAMHNGGVLLSMSAVAVTLPDGRREERAYRDVWAFFHQDSLDARELLGDSKIRLAAGSVQTQSGTLEEWRTTRRWYLGIPAWLMGSLSVAIVFMWSVLALRVLRSRRRGLLQRRQCGYDLRATPERCPECGTLRREEIIKGG